MASLSTLVFIFLFLFSFTTTSSSSSSIISRFQSYLQINTSHPTPDYTLSTSFLQNQSNSLSLTSKTLYFAPNKPLLVIKWPGTNPSLKSILLNSHTDVVPSEPTKWSHHPFSGHMDPTSNNIFARGSQDMKCVGLQYLEAVRNLKLSGFRPLRTVYLSFVPDEEIGGHDGVDKFAESDEFKGMNVGVVLDEGLANEGDEYRVFYGERCPWWLVVKATGMPGHGAKLYDGTAMENLVKSLERVWRFRESQFDLVKRGGVREGEVVSVNLVYFKAGTPTPTVCYY